MYLVTGTQADRPSRNKLLVMKLSQLAKTKHDDDDDSENDASDSDDEENDGDPVLTSQAIAHHGGVNRIRVRKADGSGG